MKGNEENANPYIDGKAMKTIVNNGFFRFIFYNIFPYALRAYLSKYVFHPQFGENMIKSSGIKFYYGNVSFGNGTRIAGNSIFANMTVGNYTVFAEGFRRIAFIHNYNAFSINDAIWKRSQKISEISNAMGKSILQPRTDYYGNVHIGSDVWIGEYVTVIGEVTIGDGAIVAARSIVTHDIPPYAIVGGAPAKFIKWRFDEDTRAFLLKLRWWDWDIKKIEDNYERLCQFDRELLNE